MRCSGTEQADGVDPTMSLTQTLGGTDAANYAEDNYENPVRASKEQRKAVSVPDADAGSSEANVAEEEGEIAHEGGHGVESIVNERCCTGDDSSTEESTICSCYEEYVEEDDSINDSYFEFADDGSYEFDEVTDDEDNAEDGEEYEEITVTSEDETWWALPTIPEESVSGESDSDFDAEDKGPKTEPKGMIIGIKRTVSWCPQINDNAKYNL